MGLLVDKVARHAAQRLEAEAHGQGEQGADADRQDPLGLRSICGRSTQIRNRPCDRGNERDQHDPAEQPVEGFVDGVMHEVTLPAAKRVVVRRAIWIPSHPAG